ncbi:uncharacterized protein TRIADDRAFT_53930 [Trichoplax adhaerens]|uniref:Centrosomal protein of 70 kDa n=1 Tax=Trichoplax adhaerens TaxID=10228 RepID=B3RME9_TRIAD|nr:hypothetical protein TRIADDRAFT_53930 [Trichoplax adhaerens]EDV27837.1 hypothetical protein TRIADDRAFT_53930 [Trichoplax adhaerens]|eukprot:XP_002109671.1 hypothetical protein TRIADDRAFT_53930 [Trichoplax adhaerens]
MDSDQVSENSAMAQPYHNDDDSGRELSAEYGSSRQEDHQHHADLQWNSINRSLRHHGLQPISFLSQDSVEIPCQNIIIMDNAMSAILRNNLSSLMDDCDRRQALIQELITTTSNFQAKSRNDNSNTEKLHMEITQLRMQLEDERIKFKEINEDRTLEIHQYTDEIETLRLSRDNYHSKYSQLLRKLRHNEKESDQLRQQYNDLIDKEEKRIDRHNEIFRLIKKKSPRLYNALDRATLEIMDAYENVIEKLKMELEIMRAETNEADSNLVGLRTDIDVLSHSSNPRAVLETGETAEIQEKANKITHQTVAKQEKKFKELQQKLKAADKQIHELKSHSKNLDVDNVSMKRELQDRPSLREWNKLKRHANKLEEILQENDISIKDRKKNQHTQDTVEDTNLQNLENQINKMSLLKCRDNIKKICTFMKIDDFNRIWPHLDGMASIADTYRLMDKLIRAIIELIAESELPDVNEGIRLQGLDNLCEENWHHIIPTLKAWIKQLHGLQELQQSINRLASTLLPWQRDDIDIFKDKALTVTEINAAVDALTRHGEDNGINIQESESDPSHLKMLQTVVQHFQKLFDVKTLSGVFTRMNDIYVKLNETYNILHSLRETLGLEENCLPRTIVAAVSKLVQIHDNASYNQIQKLLGVNDLKE